MDPLGIDHLTFGSAVEILQHLLPCLYRMSLADQPKLVGAVIDLDTQTSFDMTQVFIQLPADVGQLFVVQGFQEQVEGFGVFSQGGSPERWSWALSVVDDAIGGGYQLDQAPEEITLGQIVTLIDGPFAPISITPPETDKTPAGLRRDDQGLHQCFSQLQKLVNEHLDSHTLKDILENERPNSVLAFDI